MDTRDLTDRQLLLHLLNRADLDYNEEKDLGMEIVEITAASGYVEFQFDLTGRLVGVHGD